MSENEHLAPPEIVREIRADRVADLLVSIEAPMGDLREGLQETPERVAKAYETWFSGYEQNPIDVLKTFEDGAENYDEMVVLTDIPVYSKCVVGSTLISTPSGKIPIKELQHGDWVYCVDEQLQLHLAKCENPRVTQENSELVRIYASGDILECTPDHKVLTHNKGWIEAQHLVAGDSIVSLYHDANHDGRITLSGHGSSGERGQRVNITKMPEAKWVADYCGLVEEFLAKGHEATPKFPEGVIHHIDENPWNNAPENLQVLTIAEHNLVHKRTQKLAANPEAYAERCKQTSDGIKLNRNHRVIRVERLDYREDVYCMNVPEQHNFIANGMVVHNCEHHMADIFGVAHIAYIPDGKVVGLSKFKRLVEVFARRLQVQERLTQEIATALDECLAPKGVGVILQCRHMCMESRGVQASGTVTSTSSLKGAIKDEPETRAEFLNLVQQSRRVQNGIL